MSEGPPSKFSQRFEQLGEVNRGGIGLINAARDPVIGRYVAIKTLRPDLHEDERMTSEFGAEAQIMGQLEHPNVVPIYDLGEDDGSPFIVMKLVRGKSLGQLVTEAAGAGNGLRELPRFVQIVLRLCDAVSYAHSRSVIHCDIKPNNVMVGDFGQVYLMDWGAAVLKSSSAEAPSAEEGPPPSPVPGSAGSRTTAAESPVRVTPGRHVSSGLRGTPVYMAPEQLMGQTLDERTDVFGLGGILYEVLTGQPPNDPLRISSSGISKERMLPSKSDLWPRLPPGLCSITMKALARRPEDRYPNVDELRADLELFLEGGGWFETQVFRAGENIVNEGDPGDAAYIIQAGHCEVYKNIHGRRVLVRRLGPGDVFGETAVLTASPRTATVVAVDDVTTKVITGDSLNRELDRNPWLSAFVRSLAELFREADARLSPPRPFGDR
jgi:eukaryotic-like serine/threonine-protein kinase